MLDFCVRERGEQEEEVGGIEVEELLHQSINQSSDREGRWIVSPITTITKSLPPLPPPPSFSSLSPLLLLL